MHLKAATVLSGMMRAALDFAAQHRRGLSIRLIIAQGAWP